MLQTKQEKKAIKLILRIRKMVSIILVAAFLVNSMPINLIAHAITKDKYTETVLNKKTDMSKVLIDYEVKEKRDKFTKHFRKIDGTFEVSVYNDAVHYLNNGIWDDIDNRLVLDEKVNEYENKANKFKIKLPKTIKDNKDFKLKTEDYTFDWNILGIQDSDINIKESEPIKSNNIRILENINQSVIYKNIFDNVDLEYIIKGESVKENIILNEYKENFTVSMELKVKDLILEDQGENYVFLNEDGEVIFDLGSYYMVDSDGDISYDIDVDISETGQGKYLLTITPNENYLKSSDTDYPVVIDPTINIYEGKDGTSPLNDYYSRYNIYDGTYVLEDRHGLNVGKDGDYYSYRTYIDININDILDKSVITYANLNLRKYGPANYCTTECNVIVQQTADGQPLDDIAGASEDRTYNIDNYFGMNINIDAFDYEIIPSDAVNGQLFTWDLTRLIQKWKELGQSSGKIELKRFDESKDGYVQFYDTGVQTSYSPLVQIGYVDSAGLNNYWTYHDQNAGFAGTGFTNDYTGNLTFTHIDSSPVSDNIFSFGISHIFDNEYKDINIGYGKGWRINYSEQIENVLIDDKDNIYKYRHINGDGSSTYFDDVGDCSILPEDKTQTTLTKKWCKIAEDGSGTILNYYEDSSSDHTLYTVQSTSGLYKEFHDIKSSSSKYIKYIDTNNQKSFTVNFVYDSNRIDNIIDEEGNRAVFNYNNNLLDQIQVFRIDEDGNPSLYNVIVYEYDSSKRLVDIVDIPKEEVSNVLYEKQWYNPKATFTGEYVSTGKTGGGYFPVSHFGVDISKGDYLYDYASTSRIDYSYSYKRYEMYDKVCFQKYINDTSLGSDLNYFDEKSGSVFCRWVDSASTSHVGADNTGNYYYGVSAFTSTTDSTLSTYYYNDKQSVVNKDNAAYYKVTSVVSNNYKNPNYYYNTITWTTSSRSDKYSGDYYYDYSPRNVSFTDAYGVVRSQSTRYYATYSEYTKVYSGEWQYLSSGQTGYESPRHFDTMPEATSEYRWVLSRNNDYSNIETQGKFTYDSSNRLVSAENYYKDGVKYYYDSANKVSRTESYTKDSSNNTLLQGALDIEYHFHETRYKTFKGDEYRYLFDNYGHTINIIDDDGNITYYYYNNIFEDTEKPSNWNLNNKVVASTSTQTINNKENPTDYIESNPNLIKNPGFDTDTSQWTKSTTDTSKIYWDSVDHEVGFYETIIKGQGSTNYGSVVTINGDPNEERSIRQSVYISGNAGDSFVYGGLARGFVAHMENSEGAQFGIKLTLYKNVNNQYTVVQEVKIANFDNEVTDGQYMMDSFVTDYDYDRIDFEVVYQGVNTVSFDYLSLYKSEFKTTMEHKDAALTDDVPYSEKTGNVSRVDQPNSDEFVEYNYDDNNPYNVSSITDNKGNSGSVDYDHEANGTERVNSINALNTNTNVNVKASFEYDEHNNVIGSTVGDTSGNWFKTSTKYVKNGLFVQSETDEYGNTVNYDYDVISGLLNAITDKANVETSYTYDEYGRLIKVSKDNSNNEYIYLDGRLNEIKVNGFSYYFIYDSAGRMTEVKVNNVKLVEYKYEDYNDGTNIFYTGKALEQIYGNGDVIKFDYNEDEQIIGIKYGESESTLETRFSYVYDSKGRLYQYKDLENNETVTYRYDSIGRLEKIENGDNTLTFGYNESNEFETYTYDVFGLQRTVQYLFNDDGTYNQTKYVDYVQEYIYRTNDVLSRLGSIKVYNTTSAKTIYEKVFGYDDTSVVNGNVSTRVNSISYYLGEDESGGTKDIEYTYKYDARGNIIEITVGEERYNYDYDNLNQLIREDLKTATEQYTMIYEYDKYGNIQAKKKYSYQPGTATTSLTGTPVVISYSYSSEWKDQLSQYGDEIITYDSMGNPIKITNKNDATDYIELTWFGRQLESYTEYENGVLIKTITYKYNDSGIRIYKSVTDEITHETTEYNYFVDGDKVIAEKVTTGTDTYTIHYTYDNEGKIVSFTYDGSEYFYIRNIQGDITKIVDENGNVVVSYTYDAWGNIIDVTDDSGKELAKINPYRYRGYRYDEDSKFYYLNSRYYNSEWGRFINADGIIGQTGDILGHNMYAFCQNNPVMNLDPSGYLSKWAKIGIGIGVGIGISLITGGAGSGIGAAIIIGAIEGAAEQTITNAIEGKDLTDGVVTSAVIGGISGAVGYGVGAAAIKGVSKLKSISKVSKSVSKVSKGVSKYADDAAHNVAQFEKLKASYAAEEIFSAERVGSALKDDIHHRSASYLSIDQLASGKVNTFRGGDDLQYTLLQTKGGMNGQSGIYEYIINPKGQVSHQRFVKGGIISGFPNFRW